MRSTPRRAVTALLAAALGAAGLVTAAVPASAAPVAAAAAPCSVTTGGPARVSIDRAEQTVPVTLRTTCVGLTSANVYVVDPRGDDIDVAEWDPATDGAVYPLAIFGDDLPGTYRTDELFVEPESTEVTATYGRTVAKFGSKAGLTAARSGSSVTLTACASYYNGRRDAFVPWSAHKVTLQKLGADGRTWEFVRTVGTNARGCAVHTVQSAAAGTYRATTYETYQIFSRTSPSVRA